MERRDCRDRLAAWRRAAWAGADDRRADARPGECIEPHGLARPRPLQRRRGPLPRLLASRSKNLGPCRGGSDLAARRRHPDRYPRQPLALLRRWLHRHQRRHPRLAAQLHPPRPEHAPLQVRQRKLTRTLICAISTGLDCAARAYTPRPRQLHHKRGRKVDKETDAAAPAWFLDELWGTWPVAQ